MRALVLLPVMAMAVIPSCDPQPAVRDTRPHRAPVVVLEGNARFHRRGADWRGAGCRSAEVCGETIDFGPLVLIPPPFLIPAPTLKCSPNNTGSTSWVGAVAPSAVVPSSDPIGNAADLLQVQYFRKTNPSRPAAADRQQNVFRGNRLQLR